MAAPEVTTADATASETPPTRSAPVLSPASVLVTAAGLGALAVVVGLWVGGGAPVASPAGIPDPGVGTGWGLALARTASTLAGVLTVGLLLLGAVLVPSRGGALTGSRLRWTRAAGWSAAVWLVAVVLQAALTLSDIVATPLPEVLDATAVRSFLLDVDLGRAFVVQAALLLAVVIGGRLLSTTNGAALVGILAVGALVPPTLTGHSAASSDHAIAVSSLLVHVVSVSLWCGGLAALVLLGATARGSFPAAVPRFGTLAVWCAVAAIVSGTLNAAVRMNSVTELATTDYGRLLLLKLVGVVAILALGAWHRRTTVRRLAEDATRRLFVRVAVVEVLVMAAVIGLAVALSRTAAPVDDSALPAVITPARVVLGYDLPPDPTLPDLLWGQARLDGIMLTIAVLLAALYAAGLRSLHRRGHRWPIGRSVSWFVAVALLLAVTQTGVARYAESLFSAHMFDHMVMSMVVPVFLVLGAPVTLALRTLPQRPDEVGPRDWLQSFLRSRVVAVLANPVVAGVIFVTSFYVLYFSPLFGYLMRDHWGHAAMGVHFLLAGSLFFWSIIGVDPGPHRPPYLVRMLILLVVIPAHAFFSIALLASQTVIGGDWWLSLGRPADGLLADQQLGAGLGWAMGELPIVIVLIALFVQWTRSDDRESRRLDRVQDRADAGDTRVRDEHGDYNAMLKRLSERDRSD